MFGEETIDQTLGDISPEVEVPFYKPVVIFLSEKLTF